MLKEILCRVKCVSVLMFICHGFQVLASLDCDFEDGLCNWQNDNSGDFDWKLESWYTSSDDTGPSFDHTTGDYGHFVYIEASDQDEGDKAILSSPVQEPGAYCLTFWYNMYGINIGALNVYMKLTGGSETLILRKDKNLGNNDWRKAVINNDANETYQIVLEGVRGNGSKGDIAVDDISMKHGQCFIDLASLDCNFEDGLCNWQQWSSDDFDWLRESGDTKSDDTGPSFDHTSEGDGHYIYIEASGRGKGDKAEIYSPVQESGPYCLTFWYNMYGNGIGALNVYMILKDGNITLLLTKDKNHGNNDWRKAVISNNAKDTYRIAFEGVTGDDSKGDIAVDDISIIPTLCSLDLAFLDCNFEDGLCNWQQENSDDFDWLRESGNTPSSGTGPRSDHTTGSDGHYIYIEASGRGEGDKAVISSPLQESGPYCLTFWYNMYGNDIGALNVYMILKNGNKTPLFTKSENHGHNDWRKAVINNNAKDSYRIAFEGVRGDGSKGDIAVDDISVIPRLCSLDCDFDDGSCNWMQDDGDDFDWTLQRGPTETSNTGPEADHTSGNGQYAYIDSSQGTRGDEARLMSPLQNAGKYCFSFWYYMYGEDVDRLVVGQLYRNGTAQVGFTRKGTQGQKWFQKQLFVHTTTYFMIVFDGRVSDTLGWWNRDNGDIAIDDVQMVSCQDCENPIPKNAFANSTNFEYGSVIEITCNTGFTLVGKSLIVCQTGGSWSATPPACNPFDCGNRTIPNGNFNAAKGTTFGQTATYMCNIGYTLFGDMTVICTATGWNSTNATCEIIDCGDPTPKNAITNPTNYEYGSVIEITCNTGYSLTGESQMVCQDGGIWSASRPSCKPYDCGNSTIPDGQVTAPNGTTFGQTATLVCNIGYTLVGDTTVMCTSSGWNSKASTCKSVDAENDTLIAVYVLVPVIVVILAILFIILLLRRRLPNCKKVSESRHESRKNPVMTASNITYTGVALESQNYTNNAYEDGSAQLNDEYATITDEQNVNSNNLYYNIAGAAGTSTEHDAHNYDHTNETATHFVDESYSHVSGNINAKTFEPSYSTTLHMNSGNAPFRAQEQFDMNSYDLLNVNNCNKTSKHQHEIEEEKESDYDHAHAGGIDPVALDKDDYSHLNDLNIKQKCRASFGSGNDDEFKYSYANENSRRTGKEVEKSKAGYEQERSLKYELQDTINDDRHYFVLEAEEVKDDNHGSDNHDYFVLEETES